MNNFKIEDRIKTIIMFMDRGKKKRMHLLNASSLRLLSFEAASKTIQINEKMFHHPESKPSHCLLATVKQMGKMKWTHEKRVAHNHTGHHSVPVIRKHWNQQQCFLCEHWVKLGVVLQHLKARCCALQSWHLQQGEISVSLYVVAVELLIHIDTIKPEAVGNISIYKSNIKSWDVVRKNTSVSFSFGWVFCLFSWVQLNWHINI